MLMVLVYAPIGVAQSTSFSGSIEFCVRKESPVTSEVVGILPYTWGGDDNDNARLRSEVEAYGCTLDTVIRCSSDTPGYLALNVALRVTAPSLTKAINLPNFQKLYMHTREEYVAHQDLMRNPGKPMHDDNETQEFRITDDAPLPKYDDEGIAYFALIDHGQVASVVFLRDRPNSWFQVFGHNAITREDAVKAARSLVG